MTVYFKKAYPNMEDRPGPFVISLHASATLHGATPHLLGRAYGRKEHSASSTLAHCAFQRRYLVYITCVGIFKVEDDLQYSILFHNEHEKPCIIYCYGVTSLLFIRLFCHSFVLDDPGMDTAV